MKTITITDMHFFSEVFLYNYIKLLASSLLQIVYPEATYQRVDNVEDIKVDFTNFDVFPGTIFRVYRSMKWYQETDPSISSSKFLDLSSVLFLTSCVCPFVIFRKISLYNFEELEKLIRIQKIFFSQNLMLSRNALRPLN